MSQEVAFGGHDLGSGRAASQTARCECALRPPRLASETGFEQHLMEPRRVDQADGNLAEL